MNKRLFLSAPLVTSETDPFGDGSLKSFYRFDNNMNDDSGNGYNGSKDSGITFYPLPKVGTHMLNSMGGASNKQITLPNNFTNDETVTFWIQLMNTGSKQFDIFEKHTGTYDFFSLGMDIYNGQDRVSAYVRNNTSTYRYASSNIDFALNSWSFITYRYNSAGTHHFSINGGTEIQITPTLSSGSAPSIPNTTNKKVGQQYVNGTTYYRTPFHFDHYRAFNRALTQSEITQLYNENA